MNTLSRNIIFVGFMGVGKTTIVRKLARNMGVASVDTDMYLERRYGGCSSYLYRRHGEEAFRAMEGEALRECAELGPILISCGEGIVADEANCLQLQKCGFVVHLYSDLDTALSRIRSHRTRPLLGEAYDLQHLWDERIEQYEKVANATIDVGGKPTSLCVRQIEHLLDEHGLYRVSCE